MALSFKKAKELSLLSEGEINRLAAAVLSMAETAKVNSLPN
jgi:hypothetical protein